MRCAVICPKCGQNLRSEVVVEVAYDHIYSIPTVHLNCTNCKHECYTVGLNYLRKGEEE